MRTFQEISNANILFFKSVVIKHLGLKLSISFWFIFTLTFYSLKTLMRSIISIYIAPFTEINLALRKPAFQSSKWKDAAADR